MSLTLMDTSASSWKIIMESTVCSIFIFISNSNYIVSRRKTQSQILICPVSEINATLHCFIVIVPQSMMLALVTHQTPYKLNFSYCKATVLKRKAD